LKGNFVLPALNLVILTLIVPVLSAITIQSILKQPDYGMKAPIAGEAADKITDLYKFLLFGQYDQTVFNIFAHISVIAFSVLLGVVMFRFIASKKTVNVFYSLGITRRNLFVSKYLAGVLMLFVSVALPFLAGAVVNISTFGSSRELWSAVAFYIAAYSTLSLTAFSVTAAVFSGVGTIVEGIAFSGVVLVGPTILIYCLQFLMDRLTLGSPYGHFYDQYYQVTNSLASSLSKYNPILFMFNDAASAGALSRESVQDKFVWEAPGYGGIALWLALAAAVFALGIVLFQKRKAEICGFLGTNKWLNFLITFLIGFFPFCLSVRYNDNSILLGVVIGAGIYTALYLIIDFALIRNFREWAKGLVKLPVHLGASIIIAVIFYTGLFGFSSRVPAVDKIKSADITAASYTGIVQTEAANFFAGEFLQSVGVAGPIEGFHSEKDLQSLTKLHRMIVKAGKISADDKIGTVVRIVYHLENGRTVRRYYQAATAGILNDMLSLDETDRYRELVKRNLTEPVKKSDSEKTKSAKELFQSPSSAINVIPNHLNKKNVIDISAQQREELLAALAKDLTSQTVQQRYYPKEPAIGAIQFSMNFEKEYFNPYAPMDKMAPEYLSLADYGAVSIPVTGDMANTLEFMKANGLSELFENTDDFEFISAQVISARPGSPTAFGYGIEMTQHFMGGWSKNRVDYGSFTNAYKTTDQAVLKTMAENAHISYFNGNDGYYVRFELASGGGYTTMYVPADKVPASVKEGAAAVKPMEPKDYYVAY